MALNYLDESDLVAITKDTHTWQLKDGSNVHDPSTYRFVDDVHGLVAELNDRNTMHGSQEDFGVREITRDASGTVEVTITGTCQDEVSAYPAVYEYTFVAKPRNE